MVLQNLDHWKDILGVEPETTKLPIPETTKFDTKKLFEKLKLVTIGIKIHCAQSEAGQLKD